MPEFVIRRRFGLELQFDGDRVEKAFLLACLQRFEPIVLEEDTAVGATNGRWVLKPGPAGWEINSPAFAADTASLAEANSVLNHLRFVTVGENGLPTGRFNPITRRCAYHLHLDVSDLSALELLDVLKSAWHMEKAIQSTLPQSRLKEERVRSLRSGFPECPDQVFALGALDRKCGIHFCDYLSRGSMEITYASGTSDASKILNWLVFWHCIVERTLQVGPFTAETNNIADVCDWLLLNTDTEGEEETTLGSVRTFLLDRADKMREQRRQRILSDA